MAESCINSSLISSLSKDDLELCEYLCNCGQKNVLASFTTLEPDVRGVAVTYPGGVMKYVESAKKLIYDSTQNINPLDGFKAEIPSGVNLEYKQGEYCEVEKLGRDLLKHTGFALVGGGIGERLNSKDIKLSLTSDLVRDECFLENYCNFIHAIETEFNCENPLAIMTSDGTHNPTSVLLKEHNYYGMKEENITLMKQNGVPAIKNTECEIAVEDDGHMILKPHGHGDIHLLMNQFGLPQKWASQGIKYIIFFQDTNGLSVNGFAPLLGITDKYNFDFCSMTIVRKPGEKVGGICKLVKEDGTELTCNVEYNQLESVLKESTGKGDVANENGNSNYPGNINLLCIRVDSYISILKESGGVVNEFVNPKYKDSSRKEFIKPVRLECMMQDYPKLLMNHNAKVGFLSLPRWLCFSAVKNCAENAIKQAAATGYPESFYSGEEDIYKFYRRVLRENGVMIGDKDYDESLTTANGLPKLPIVICTGRGSLTPSDIAKHFGKNVVIKDHSVVVIDGKHVTFENVVIEGTVIVKACDDANVIIKNCEIKNKGWTPKKVELDDNEDSKYTLRGYKFIKEEAREITCNEAGEFVFEQ